jgi:nitroreductase
VNNKKLRKMEYTNLIKVRESVRNYDPGRPVDKEILEKILDAGRMAPSACNYQPFKYLVVSSPDMLLKVRACYGREWFKEAPHILVIVGLKDQAWKRSYDGYSSIETDAAITMTHIILAAENEGVGTCWIAAYNPAILKEALNIEDNQLIFGITPLGYPKPGYLKAGVKRRKNLGEMVEYL